MSCCVSKWLRRDSVARLTPQTSQTARRRFAVVVSPVCCAAYSSSVLATRIFPGKHVMTFVFAAFVFRPMHSKRLTRIVRDDCSHSGHHGGQDDSILSAIQAKSRSKSGHQRNSRQILQNRATESRRACAELVPKLL